MDNFGNNFKEDGDDDDLFNLKGEVFKGECKSVGDILSSLGRFVGVLGVSAINI